MNIQDSPFQAFDRYRPFTDVEALAEASAKPLRKSKRVNTLKTSIEEVQAWGVAKGWTMEPVPWCREGFFIDREDRETALGKDLLHLLGHTYMQEAASMLPVELLDIRLGQTVLDMASAPGSKTTQIAAKMRGGSPFAIPPPPNPLPPRGRGEDSVAGVIVANDVQEKRLWTLKAALHRSGVTNVIVTKKVGQWFGKQMTERFDRVLCDAPCTAQGTARKDSDALLYSSEENVGKMARLQKELLESAVHAATVGGLIVYSTCTLTPEENEGVVRFILEKFSGKLEAVDPRAQFPSTSSDLAAFLDGAIDDSARVQEWLASTEARTHAPALPLLRLWPQRFDTEGFFAAVLRKTAPTRDRTPLPPVRFQEDVVPIARQTELAKRLEDTYGTSFLLADDRLFQRGTQLILSTEEVNDFHLPVQNYALGMPFGRRLDDGRVRIDHEIATLRGHLATRGTTDVGEEELEALLAGKDIACPANLTGDVLIRFAGRTVGFGVAKQGKLLNRLPRWLIQHA